MAQTVDATLANAPDPAPPRVTHRSLGRRMLMRPEIGSLIGVIVIYIFFYVVASPFRSPQSLATILYASSTIGMMAVPVALLMIGGEFDLSAGVAVTTAALVAALTSYNLNLSSSRIALTAGERRYV